MHSFAIYVHSLILIGIVRGPSPRVPGGQGARMGSNIVVGQQRQQQNQTVPQPQTQQVMYLATQPFMQLNFGKFPPGNYSAHTVRFPYKCRNIDMCCMQRNSILEFTHFRFRSILFFVQSGQYNNFSSYYVPVIQQQQRINSNPQHINSLSKPFQPIPIRCVHHSMRMNLMANFEFTDPNVSGAGSTPVQTHQQNAHHINHALHMQSAVTSFHPPMQRSQPVNIIIYIISIE